MTDADLIKMHQTLLDVSEVAALRAIYNAGYCAGAAVTVAPTIPDYSTVQPRPDDNALSTLKRFVAQKR